MARPNIVFFHAESWDGRALGCMGHPAMGRATPNIDELAAGGALFRRTYCSHPICCPSRANMWSGLYTHHCESWNNHKGLEPGDRTVLDLLHDAGYSFCSDDYRDIGLGKSDYRSGGHSQLARVTAWTGPADIRLPVYGRGAQDLTISTREDNAHDKDWRNVAEAKAFLKEQRDRDSPFFLYIATGAVHPSFRTTAHWMERIDIDRVQVPPEDEEVHPVLEYQRIAKNWRHGFDPETVKMFRAAYYAMGAEADAMVGEIAGALDEMGLRDNTYFIFSSDHGEMATEHRNWYKMMMYEGASRVPLIINGPGVRPGLEVENIVSLIDIFPTISEMTDIDAPSNLDGESLLPLARGETDKSRDRALALFTGTASNTTMFMLRRDEWKYVAYPGYGPQLFDLEEDPDEIRNLAASRPEVAESMDEELRSMVDYEEVHRRVMRYDREAFREWRERAKAGEFRDTSYSRSAENPATTYEEIMANCYVGWSQEHEEKLNAWLEAGDSDP
jgi:arylsulfatase K